MRSARLLFGATQPAGEHAQQLFGDFGAIGDPCPQRVAVHRDRANFGDGGGARRPGAGVEERHLAEHVRGAHDGEQVFLAVRRTVADLDLARNDDVDPVAGLTLGEHGVPAGEVDGLQLFGQCGGRSGFAGTAESFYDYCRGHAAALTRAASLVAEPANTTGSNTAGYEKSSSMFVIIRCIKAFRINRSYR
jgi:hypothetical protein